jgi:hypothetical protein
VKISELLLFSARVGVCSNKRPLGQGYNIGRVGIHPNLCPKFTSGKVFW